MLKRFYKYRFLKPRTMDEKLEKFFSTWWGQLIGVIVTLVSMYGMMILLYAIFE